MMTLYKSYVSSRSVYFSMLGHLQSIEDVEVIQGVHRTCTAKISFVRDLER